MHDLAHLGPQRDNGVYTYLQNIVLFKKKKQTNFQYFVLFNIIFIVTCIPGEGGGGCTQIQNDRTFGLKFVPENQTFAEEGIFW